MVKIKKCAFFVVFALLISLLFSAAVYADAPSDYRPEYVYYETEIDDDEWKMVKANIREAAENYDHSQDARILYNTITSGIRKALGNYKEVWVMVKHVDYDHLVDYVKYSEAIRDDDIDDLWDAIDDGGYSQDDEPDYDFLLEIEDGVPKELPDERQDWLEKNPEVKREVFNDWMLTLTFNFDEGPFDDHNIGDWDDFDLTDDDNNVHIKGVFVGSNDRTQPLRGDDIIEAITGTDGDDNPTLTVFISDTEHFPSNVDVEELRVNYRDIALTIDGVSYTWYGEIEEDDPWWQERQVETDDSWF